MVQSTNDIVIAINEEDLGQFAMDILTLSEDISDLFSSIDTKMNNLKTYFDCEEYQKLMNFYASIHRNYSVVKNSLVSYSDDLIAVINKVKAGDTKLAFMIDEISQLASAKAKEIENL